MCELCGAPTILDETSVEELLRVPVAEAVSYNYCLHYNIIGKGTIFLGL